MTNDNSLIEAMARAVEASAIALDDWLNLYASDLCDPKRVAEAQERVGQYGRLGYIASVQEQNRAALKAYREHEEVL